MPGGSILMTSAPKSDMTVAAAGPAIKLAQSMTLSPSKMRSVTSVFLVSNGETVGVAVAHDTAGGRAGEMRADDQNRPLRQFLQHALARPMRRVGIAVGRRRPFRMRDLAGVVHEIAGDQRFLAFGPDDEADMSRRVARRRHEADFVRDAVIHFD